MPKTGSRFGGAKGAQALKGMKDFILFEKSNHKVLVEGVFDENWQLTPTDKEELESYGVSVEER